MKTTYEVHPAIGIARVGSSDSSFIGSDPEVAPPASFRDSQQKLLRQAVRYRVFSVVRDDQGAIVGQPAELTPDKATLAWTVQLVNRKAAAPMFLAPGGLGKVNTDPTIRRNGATGQDSVSPDIDLIIKPTPKTLTGPSQPVVKFGDGKFRTTPVPLGEMSTDAQGRLVVAGGKGKSDSPTNRQLQGFADNDDWYDDTSDGPVTVSITLAGGTVVPPDQIRPAWFACCQPDFAPEIVNLVTLHDVLVDLGVKRGLLPSPGTPAFDRDIKPILDRVLNYRWVNKEAFTGHGPGGPGNFANASLWGDLSDPTNAQIPDIFALLRDPSIQPPQVQSPAPKMPLLFSDGYPSDRLPLPLTSLQYGLLADWAAGSFTPTAAAGGPVETLPEALTRMALEACVGGAFYPGIELGRKMRDTTIYLQDEVFRIDHTKVGAGELTQSMALPWQADFYDCESEGRFNWWPAQRPDDVFTDASQLADRAPTTKMVRWERPLTGGADLVKNWDKLGIVVKVNAPGVGDVFLERERVLP
jgi:hypothetical protein